MYKQPRGPVATDTTDYGADAGSVRRARERVGAGLTYIQSDDDLRSTAASIAQSPPQNSILTRSSSQQSAQWQHDAQKYTAQDILQHPLMARPSSPPPTTGELHQDFKFPFPSPPQPIVPPPRKSKELRPPTARRIGPTYYTQNAHVSPIVEEGPDSSLRSKSVYSRRSSGGLAHAASNLNIGEAYSTESPASSPVVEESQVARQASLAQDKRPALATIRSWESSEQGLKKEARPHPPTRQATLEALSAAVASGVGTHHQDVPDISSPNQRTNTAGLRMPFDSSPPLSPQSIDDPTELEPPRLFDAPGSTRSRSPLLTSNSNHSPESSQLQSSGPGLSEKIRPSNRPQDLNLENSARNSKRSSSASLADLIKRATKLAANLDRGKTASRLGMLDMFYGDEGKARKRLEELNGKKRESGISDMLGAFPDPGTPVSRQLGTSEKGQWPSEGMAMSRGPTPMPFRPGAQNRRQRRCCGMKLGCFVLLMVIVILLVAAAVLVPIFLIVVPRLNKGSSPVTLNSCQSDWKCGNGGVNTVTANDCSCICVGGWTGDHCTQSRGADCVTATAAGVVDATMGQSIPRLIEGSNANFSVPLNGSYLLGMFSANNLSCVSEETLVNFDLEQRRREKRFYPWLMSGKVEVDLGPLEPVVTSRPGMFDVVARRDANPETNTVASSNGIVFQATTSTAVGQATASATTTSGGTAAPSSSPTATVSDRTLDFARVVVLYVFEQSGTLSVAVNAQQMMRTALMEIQAGSVVGVVDVGFGDLQLTANMALQRVVWGNGTVVGS